MEKEKIEKEKAQKREEKEKNKEDIVFIKGQKVNSEENSILNKNENRLKEIKYKEELEIENKDNKRIRN